MNSKNDILESWIMVEHLSEGNISLRDKNIKTWNELHEEYYYNLFKDEIKKKRLKSYQKGGIVLYFNVFSFNEIVELLRKEYHLSPSEEEIEIGDKFSFALYFDKDLKLNKEMTFFTVSYYIRQFKNVPREKEFIVFEEEGKKYIEDLFDFHEDANYEKHFNSALKKLLDKYTFDIKQCRMKVVSNLETEETNLHSFYVKDLEKAKHIKTDNLNAYVLGKTAERIDLDCRFESDKYNPDTIYRILHPSNYPVSRFPSNPQHALSLMQQVAVNLAIGYDDKKMRSVNGPPGTGKTTLLKDIFSELIVEQAVDICELPNKEIFGSEETAYYDKASIGKMPETIAEKGIMVVSSNNGAVQNIVNELPLTSEISEVFRDDILEADYFREIANSKVSIEWVKGNDGKSSKELKSEKSEDIDKFWGVFSLEGGKKDNMKYIITVLEHIVAYLYDDYESDVKVYDNFMAQYEKVQSYKEECWKNADEYEQMQKLSKQAKIKEELFLKDKKEKEKIIKEKNISATNEIKSINTQMMSLGDEFQVLMIERNKLKDDKEGVNESIQAVQLQKPCFFTRRKIKLEYKEKLKGYSEQLLLIIERERQLSKKKAVIENKKQECKNRLISNKEEVDAANIQLENWIQKSQDKLKYLQERIKIFEKKLNYIQINALDMGLEYDEIQKSSPWFDGDYRKMQSELFINALKVRKQFLYENRKSIKAASIIWNKQNDHINNKIVISQAWNWMNMAIPVISSTFASVSRMCSNFDKETLGQLFIDEAGQALPQASVGAIFRSRNVMAVGDPAQIKPVMTLDSSILSMLGEAFGVSKKYLSDSSSTQTLIDEMSQYGFYKDAEKEEWTGIPLWVHRRCKYPMFSISNKISYGGNMVQSSEERGKAEWYDIRGSAKDKYVKEQGEFLREKITEMIKDNPDIVNKGKKDLIYVISPFKNVAFQLARELKNINFTRYDENRKPTNVGTVHTFQGKEAAIVFLVLGADSKSSGAANWAIGTGNPNIMNVAATRAKKEFYIIGDKQLYINLNSDVINNTYEIISQFNSEISGV